MVGSGQLIKEGSKTASSSFERREGRIGDGILDMRRNGLGDDWSADAEVSETSQVLKGHALPATPM